MDTLLIVVVDQLSWQDTPHFPKLRGLLGEATRIQVPYFPTVTETAHASFAFSAMPEQHGVIGSEWFVESPEGTLRRRGIDPTSETDSFGGDAHRVVVELARRNVECFVVAGKPNVAHLLFPGLVVSHQQVVWVPMDRSTLSLRPRAAKPFDIPCPRDNKANGLDDPRIDSLLIEQAGLLLDKVRRPEKSANCLLFLGLPMVDRLGHWNCRESDRLRTHFERLDQEVTRLIEANLEGDTAVVITGDHGWRKTDTAVWVEATGFWRLRHGGNEEHLGLPGGVRFDENRMPAIICDGGTVRLWTTKGKEEAVAEWLIGVLKEDLDSVRLGVGLSDYLNEFQSNHSNWGNVVGLAARHVALCKKEWITKNGITRVPCVEHGTHFPEDRTVPLWRTGNAPSPEIVHRSLGEWILGQFA